MRLERSPLATVGAVLAGAVLVSGLSGCSSDQEDAAVPAESDEAMIVLCDRMIADAMSPEEADALAVENGYVSRVGSIDGEAMAVTMDYRADRFTFEVVDGVVTACTYG